MLSIRTQDRMALVPYNSKLSIEYNHYKIANKDEIEKVSNENKKLRNKLMYEAEQEKTNIAKNLAITTLEKRWEEQKKEIPKETYNEWHIKSNGESDYGILGIYKTKERALEVLNEIEKYVVGKLLIPISTYEMREELTFATNPYMNVPSQDIVILPIVYQMPKEEE